jgi:integrase/recombinase XerD
VSSVSRTRRRSTRQPKYVPYRLAEVKRVWRENRSLTGKSIAGYEYWLYRFSRYCQLRNLDQVAELTRDGGERFARWWRLQSHQEGRLNRTISGSRMALRAWSFALTALGESTPPWSDPPPDAPIGGRFEAFANYLRDVRGILPKTIRSKIVQLDAFDQFRRSRRARSKRMSLQDVDAYLVACSRRLARPTVAGISSTIRHYLRFLHATGAVKVDLSASVMTPAVRPLEKPYRALPWDDIQRVLRAADRSTAKGRRGYAILLMMTAYGLGAGEIMQITLDDIDWKASTIRISRPKTRVEFNLPLLPDVARAVADYLKHGRPVHTPTRHLFVGTRMPFNRLKAVAAIRNVLHSAARRANVELQSPGTHALRHTHATRQLELGVAPTTIGSILGHRSQSSTSAYLRVASNRLRKLSLPVPV